MIIDPPNPRVGEVTLCTAQLAAIISARILRSFPIAPTPSSKCFNVHKPPFRGTVVHRYTPVLLSLTYPLPLDVLDVLFTSNRLCDLYPLPIHHYNTDYKYRRTL